mgnify:CR=1 FL=1
MHVYEMGVINMLNAERYKNEILEKSNVVFDFSISKDRHTIEKCLGVCDNCIFCNMGEHCSNVKVKWLLSEYKEPIKLSKLEYDILKWIKENTQFEYIVRNEIGHLFASSEKPTKQQYVWTYRERNHELSIFDKLFKFVKCEDEEPIVIADILNNCEVI